MSIDEKIISWTLTHNVKKNVFAKFPEWKACLTAKKPET